MSFWKSKTVRGIAKTAVRAVAAYYTGGASEAVLAAKQRAARPTAFSNGVLANGGMMNGGIGFPGAGYTRVGGLAGLTALPRITVRGATPPGLGYMIGRGVGGIRNIARSAMGYCRRHPQWCSTIGGVAAVEALVSGGQLPPLKRRRSRGITARELGAFRRVSKTLNKWCKTPAPTQRARRKC